MNDLWEELYEEDEEGARLGRIGKNGMYDEMNRDWEEDDPE